VIQCLLTSYAGNTDFPSRMQECYDNFLLITVAIGNNPQLISPTATNTIPVVRYAQILDYTFEAASDAKGQSIGHLAFGVRCEQRITSLT
jgi:hypothetical protein